MEYRFAHKDDYEKYLVKQMRAELTVASYMMEMTMFFAWLARLYPNLEVYQIGYRIVTRYIEEEVKSGKQISTVNKKITSLKAYFHFLWVTGKIGMDPCAKLKRLPNTSEEDNFFLSDDEIDFLLHTIHEDKANKIEEDIYFRNMSFITLFLWAGLKIQEAAHLLWKDILWEGTSTIIGVSLGSVRRVVLQDSKGDYLKKYKQFAEKDSPFVFISRQGKRMSARSIQFVLASLSRKSGISFHAQKLRNTFAVKKLKEGYTEEEVADLLGIDKWIIPALVYEEIARM
ncbi:tyrosine-type recombinase/integrase [Aneurinibacillus terranovensis]|uniref:tyrosine-type recombinase/integrase n=1 Tax=Aneurinibacillus terranovensis TaxID=278991 RepID=UPI00042A5A8C|nr:tyrosine-type recombinase/integrase [Aneurinibacillus terranovensis]